MLIIITNHMAIILILILILLLIIIIIILIGILIIFFLLSRRKRFSVQRAPSSRVSCDDGLLWRLGTPYATYDHRSLQKELSPN